MIVEQELITSCVVDKSVTLPELPDFRSDLGVGVAATVP